MSRGNLCVEPPPEQAQPPPPVGRRSLANGSKTHVHGERDLTPSAPARPSILAMVTFGMFLNRSPIVCVRRKLRVRDTILEAAPNPTQTRMGYEEIRSALCKTTTRTLSSASSSLPSLSNSADRTSSRRFIGG